MAKIMVAGHICLDIIPKFSGEGHELEALMVPGSLTEVGQAVVATGGAVSNTGQALYRLGDDVVLAAKIGDDEFGHTIQCILSKAGSGLADGLIVDSGSATSYSVVINPPGVDRIFLHSPGANHTFGADDIDYEGAADCDLFHFGYPPLMKQIYEQDGAEMKAIFERVKAQGAVTSMDMTFVDPASPAGKVDWLAFLKNVLPVTDIFLPSLDEILFMVDRDAFERLAAEPGDLVEAVSAEQIEAVAQTLIDFGALVVAIKLGKHGYYLRTANEVPGRDERWKNISRFESCFAADVKGTTGAGDCSIAGFLSAFVNGGSAEEALTMAVAAGSASTESLNATDAIPSRQELEERIRNGWKCEPGRFISEDG